MIVSKTRNTNGWGTKVEKLIPNGVKCNEKTNWVSVSETRNSTDMTFFIGTLWGLHVSRGRCLTDNSKSAHQWGEN